MISILVPFKNEEKNLTLLYQGIAESLSNKNWELILINDGSTDASPQEAHDLSSKDNKVRILNQRKSFGKGRALADGFKIAKGDIIVFMDADLEDNPAELPKFIEKIDEGYDLVNGWRKNRDHGFSKTIPSKIGNILILKWFLHSHFHDVNCGYKALKREILETIQLYGDILRFLPFMAVKEGYKTTEIPVHHSNRKYGVSKYGFFRRFSIFMDILTSYFIYRFREKPLHFFGGIGAFFLLLGIIPLIYLLFDRIFFGHLLYRRPLFLLTFLPIIVGIQVIMTGILAELIVYLRFQKKENG
jgi:glycosyltransferase involved in cell wall biosynthesis